MLQVRIDVVDVDEAVKDSEDSEAGCGVNVEFR